MPYGWQLLCFVSDLFSFKGKHHIRGAFKEANVTFPAYAAFAVEQTNERLLHLVPAVWAYSFRGVRVIGQAGVIVCVSGQLDGKRAIL